MSLLLIIAIVSLIQLCFITRRMFQLEKSIHLVENSQRDEKNSQRDEKNSQWDEKNSINEIKIQLENLNIIVSEMKLKLSDLHQNNYTKPNDIRGEPEQEKPEQGKLEQEKLEQEKLEQEQPEKRHGFHYVQWGHFAGPDHSINVYDRCMALQNYENARWHGNFRKSDILYCELRYD